MAEHRCASFGHSCVRTPVDPYSRQPTPSYERAGPPPPSRLEWRSAEKSACRCAREREQQRERHCKCDARTTDNRSWTELENAREDYNSLIEFITDIPDYEEVHDLTHEQFKQKLDYLKRRQRLLLKNLQNCLEQEELVEPIRTKSNVGSSTPVTTRGKSPCEFHANADLTLKGKRCTLEDSRSNSPLLYPLGTFSSLAEDQDLLTYRCKEQEKAEKTRLNEELLSADKRDWLPSSCSKTPETPRTNVEPETRSPTPPPPPPPPPTLPPAPPTPRPRSPKRWQPTLPRPFSFTLSSPTGNADINDSVEDAEKYMDMIERQALAEHEGDDVGRLGIARKRNPARKRRIRQVPLTSKIPLYDKLMAEKEERSRIVREESALTLLSQVRPFKLECDRRALRALTRSSPELRGYAARRSLDVGLGFKAKPVPRNLFSTDVYDRMIEDEYFRNLQKRLRAAELLSTSSLPPSMARRERCKSAVSSRSQNTGKSASESRTRCSTGDGGDPDHACLDRETALPSRCSVLPSTLPPHGNNLAALLRAQASRQKIERELQQKLEEKRREQMLKLRKALIGRKPAWRALRSAARNEHERDLDFRVSLRRDEAREQAERHRLQMELMLDRVTRIPTLFERYSQDELMLQSFQSRLELQRELSALAGPGLPRAKSRALARRRHRGSSSAESYLSPSSSPRAGSGSLTSSSSPGGGGGDGGCAPVATLSRSSGSGKSSADSGTRKKSARGPLKVSINENAEFIEAARPDRFDDEDEDEDEDGTEGSLWAGSARCEAQGERGKRGGVEKD